MDRLFVPSFFVCIYFSVIFLVPLPLQSLGAEDIWWKQVGCSTVISEHRRTSVLVVLLPPPSPNTLFQASEAFFCVPLHELQTKSMPWKSFLKKLIQSVGNVSGKTSHFFGGKYITDGCVYGHICMRMLCMCVCVHVWHSFVCISLR